jgi:hypothetical protein
VEADLQRFYGIDYRDRWRGGLTLRRLLVLIRHLPEESALTVALADGMRWSLEAHLLDDLRMWLTGSKKQPAKPHPARPLGNPKRLNAEAIAAGRRRRALSLRAIEAGEIT